MARKSRKEVLSPSEKFSKAESHHAKAWWWQKDRTLKELEAAATLMIDAPTTLEHAKWHHERMLRHELLSHLAPRAYACWIIVSRQELDAVTAESCVRVFYEVVPEFKEEAFFRVLGYVDTIERAKSAYYAAGDKEPAFQARALERWRNLSDQEIVSAATYDETVRAMKNIPHREEERRVQAIELALERCVNGREVIDWLDEFGRWNSAWQGVGARKLLEFAEAADPVSA